MKTGVSKTEKKEPERRKRRRENIRQGTEYKGGNYIKPPMTFEPRDAVYLPNALPKPRKREKKKGKETEIEKIKKEKRRTKKRKEKRRRV